MPYLVQKFGGTSLATVARIQRVARYVQQKVKAGYQVVVVVLAMAGFTNQLAEWVTEATPHSSPSRARI